MTRLLLGIISVGGFPIGSGKFKMDGLQDPKRKSGTFSSKESGEISRKLAMVGLNCSANTSAKIRNYASSVVSTIAGAQDPKATQVHITSPVDKAKDNIIQWITPTKSLA